MRLLTTGEAADYLRLKERKLYELVATGAIPCTKITGRWLFPQDELDRWLTGSLVRPDGMALAEPMPIVGGSHDPLLEWALRESGCGLASLPEGSESGFTRFMQGEVIAAAVHLHARDADDTDANAAALRGKAALVDAVLIAFARREQGLLVAAGNPKGLRTLVDVVAARARMATRPQGAGAQQLLEALLQQAKITPEKLRLTPPSPTGPDVAQAIRAGRADCGVATRAVATAAGLDFVPLVWEHFDLLMRQRHYFRAPLQPLIRFLGSAALAERARELGGYDVSAAGQVRFAP